MTVTNTANRWEYIGDGVTTTFPFTNLIFAATDLLVTWDGALKVLTTDYTIPGEGIGNHDGGNVVFTPGNVPPPGVVVTLVRAVPETQLADLEARKALPADVVEAGLDKLTVLVQQLRDGFEYGGIGAHEGWRNQGVVKAGAFTIAAADQGKTIICESAPWTLTFPDAATMPEDFVVALYNPSFTRAILVTFQPFFVGLDYWLFPLQTQFVGRAAGSRWWVRRSLRWQLLGDATYYVSPAGLENNDGLAATHPTTLYDALYRIRRDLDFNALTVTLQFAAGTYADAIDLGETVNWVGGGKLMLRGDPVTPGNVILNTGPGINTILVAGVKSGPVHVSGFAFTGAGTHIAAFSGAHVGIAGACAFGATAGFHVVASRGARVYISAAYTIDGGATAHFKTNLGGHIGFIQAVAATLSGTFNFGGAFADADSGATIHAAAGLASFVGGATGARYNVATNAVIATEGGGAAWFPGSVAGVTATGGQYT